jgi:hypothetical protein
VISLQPNLQSQNFNIKAVAVTPGFANTDIFKFASPFMTWITAPLRWATLKPAEDGGAELVYAAIAKNAHGVYFGERNPTHSTEHAMNKELSGDLWKYTENVVNNIINTTEKK